MEYTIRKIKEEREIEQCDLFEINHYQWNSSQKPKAYGYAGYLEGKGIYVKLICEEKDPKRVYRNHRDKVYQDSAMEIFMAFPEKGEPLLNDVMYLNFEMNANSAMYAAFGKGRKNRAFISEEMYKKSGCKAVIEEERWTLTVTIPEEFLQEICRWEDVKRGETFYCNFYKISESKEIEHYGSFSPIESETPNFHMPVCFAKCKVSENV